MNLEDLMEVWRSQDTAPLHGVNETLLRLALRQDEAKLRARRRREMWFVYISMAVLVGLMTLFLAIMIDHYDDDILSGWDYAVAVVGLAAALILSGMIYVGYRTQTLRVQGFGVSAALAFVAARINDKPYDQAWAEVRGAILFSPIGVGAVGWYLRRMVRRDLAPRKRRLEALLKEFDG
jgi:hypothetical protein